MEEATGPKPAEETWTYAGRVALVKPRKLVHCWVDGSGTERLYPGRKTFAIGRRYTARVTRDGERVTLYGDPEPDWRAEKAGQDDRLKWEARDTANAAAHQGERLHKAAKAARALAEVLEPLRKTYQTTNPQGRRAIIAEVLTILQRTTPFRSPDS